MFSDPAGPIEHFSWGRFVICGKEHSRQETKLGVGKDIRLIQQDVTEWKERKGHLLTLEMITGVWEQKIEILVIGNGVNGALECPASVIQGIQARENIQVVIAKTPQACELYNRLYKLGKRVALLAHGTC